jgi:hypothetical protein
MSPEVLRGGGYEWSSDVWSLGCILFELAMLRSPFKEDGLSIYGLFQKITAGAYQPVSDLYSFALRDLVRRMLLQDPAERPSIDEVCIVADHMRDETARQRVVALAAVAASVAPAPPILGEPDHAPPPVPHTVIAPAAVIPDPSRAEPLPFPATSGDVDTGGRPLVSPRAPGDASENEDDFAVARANATNREAVGAPHIEGAPAETEFGRALQSFRHSLPPRPTAAFHPALVTEPGISRLQVPLDAEFLRQDVNLVASSNALLQTAPVPAVGDAAPALSHALRQSAGGDFARPTETIAAGNFNADPAPSSLVLQRPVRSFSVESAVESAPPVGGALGVPTSCGNIEQGSTARCDELGDLADFAPLQANTMLVDILCVLGAFDSATGDVPALPRVVMDRCYFSAPFTASGHHHAGSGTFSQFLSAVHAAVWMLCKLGCSRSLDLFFGVQSGQLSPHAASAQLSSVCMAELQCPRDVFGASPVAFAAAAARGYGSALLRFLLWLAAKCAERVAFACPLGRETAEPEAVVEEESGDGYDGDAIDNKSRRRSSAVIVRSRDAEPDCSSADAVVLQDGCSSPSPERLPASVYLAPDPFAWQAEAARVSGRLAAFDKDIVRKGAHDAFSSTNASIESTAIGDSRQWRSHVSLICFSAAHLREAGESHDGRGSVLAKLAAIADDCLHVRDVVDKRERRLNFSGVGHDGGLVALVSARSHEAVAAGTARDRVLLLETRVTSLASELSALREECEELALSLQQRVSDLSGQESLRALRAALVALRHDNHSLQLQLGVLQNRHGQLLKSSRNGLV